LKEGEMQDVKMKEEKKRESESTGHYANTFEKGFSVRIIPGMMLLLHLSSHFSSSFALSLLFNSFSSFIHSLYLI